MARIGNPQSYSKKLREDFRILRHKMVKESYRLKDGNEVINLLTQLENYLEDEIQSILTNP